jgi:choline kinase
VGAAKYARDMNIAQAIILAAGRGSRLGEAGRDMPKCLLPLAGKPLLDWTGTALHACGVREILIVAGWQAERLRATNRDIVINERWAQTNSVRSLMLADAWLERAPSLIVYGDGAYSRAVLAAVIDAAQTDLLVPGDRLWHALWSRRTPTPLDDAETWRSEHGALRDIGARVSSASEAQAQFMGLLRVTPAGWRTIRSRLAAWERSDGSAAIDRMDTTAMLRRLLADGIELPCIEVDGGWVEIDTDEDRQVVERALQEPGFSHDFR